MDSQVITNLLSGCNHLESTNFRCQLLSLSTVEAVEEAESVLRRVLEGLSSPALAGLTCTPAFLQEKTQSSLDSIDTTTANFSLYNNDPSGMMAGACCLTHVRTSSPGGLVFLYRGISVSLTLLPALGKALSSLPSLSHALGEVMVQGVSTSHMASAEEGQSKHNCDRDELLHSHMIFT